MAVARATPHNTKKVRIGIVDIFAVMSEGFSVWPAHDDLAALEVAHGSSSSVARSIAGLTFSRAMRRSSFAGGRSEARAG
jgi:hypothetical protein